jgi:hypothetical protein
VWHDIDSSLLKGPEEKLAAIRALFPHSDWDWDLKWKKFLQQHQKQHQIPYRI